MALTQEFKFAKVLVNKIHQPDWNDREFACYIVGMNGAVIERVIKMFATIIWGLANAYDQELWNDDNRDAMVKAKQIQDAIQHFRY